MLTFDLISPIDHENRRLMISANQIINEQELVSNITPILNRVNPNVDDKTGNLLDTLSISKEGPLWILSRPDSKGIRHRIGITVSPKLLNKLIRELIICGYRIN